MSIIFKLFSLEFRTRFRTVLITTFTFLEKLPLNVLNVSFFFFFFA